MATLAAIGGRWLRDGASGPVPELLADNSSFQYVGSFTAELAPRRLLRRARAVGSPEQWLAGLHSLGARDLSLLTDLSTGGPLPPISHLRSPTPEPGHSWPPPIRRRPYGHSAGRLKIETPWIPASGRSSGAACPARKSASRASAWLKPESRSAKRYERSKCSRNATTS